MKLHLFILCILVLLSCNNKKNIQSENKEADSGGHEGVISLSNHSASSDSKLAVSIINHEPFIFYEGVNKAICFANAYGITPPCTEIGGSAKSGSPLVTGIVSGLPNVFYIGADNRIHNLYHSTGKWSGNILNESQLPCRPNSPLSFATVNSLANIFYIGTDNKVHNLYFTGSIWQSGILNSKQVLCSDNSALGAGIAGPYSNVFYIGIDHKIYNFYFTNVWNLAVTNPAHLRCHNNTDLAVGVTSIGLTVFYIAVDNIAHFVVYENTNKWESGSCNNGENVLPNSLLGFAQRSFNDGSLCFVNSDNKVGEESRSGAVWYLKQHTSPPARSNSRIVYGFTDFPQHDGEIRISASSIFYFDQNNNIEWTSP